MNTVTLAHKVQAALKEDNGLPGQHLQELVNKVYVIGWQFRFVYPTYKTEWSPIFEHSHKVHTGDPAPPGATFEVRDVYALVEEQS